MFVCLHMSVGACTVVFVYVSAHVRGVMFMHVCSVMCVHVFAYVCWECTVVFVCVHGVCVQWCLCASLLSLLCLSSVSFASQCQVTHSQAFLLQVASSAAILGTREGSSNVFENY